MTRLMTALLAASFLTQAAVAQTAVAQAVPQPAPAAARPPAPMGPAGSAPAVAISPENSIPLEVALDAARTALNTCLKLPKSSAAVVAVFDSNGNIRVQLAADGAGLQFFDIARRKAYTVLKKQMASGDFGKSLGPLPRGAVIEGDPTLVNFPGGLPITQNGTIIGALAVSGPTGGVDDLACAQAGLAEIHPRD